MENDIKRICDYYDQSTDAEKENFLRVLDALQSTGDTHDRLCAWIDSKQHYGLKPDEVAAFLDSIGA